MDKNNDFRIADFELTLLIYLYKIIEEKFYWESKNLIDLNDEFQLKDNYMNYYNLFNKIINKYEKNENFIDNL